MPIDESVAITLGKDTTEHFERYSVKSSILQQPSAWSAQLSATGGTAQILNAYPIGTDFSLAIAGATQFKGKIDGFDAAGSSGSTSITFHGRDVLAQLFDNDVDAERSFVNVTLEETVRAALREVGLGSAPLRFDNADNRTARASAKATVITEPKTFKGTVFKSQTVHAKIGETWFQFLQRHLAKLGLFIWADASGGFVVSRPNRNQEPLFHFARRRGNTRNVVNVEDAHWKNDSTHRFSHTTCYGRSGGKKFGHLHIKGEHEDKEMGKLGLKKLRVFRDVHAADSKEAELFARRKIAEVNRHSWQLVYSLAGHTAPTDASGGRAIVIPDTLARVEDDELGIHDTMYIESVEYTSPPRITKVTLMRLQDLIFGEDD